MQLKNIALTLAFTLSCLFALNANSATCPSNSSPTSSCTDLNLNSAGDIAIGSTVVVTNSAVTEAVQNTGNTSSITNAGTLSGTATYTGTGILNNSSSVIGMITNNSTGSIVGTSTGSVSGANQNGYGILNNGTINNINNSGLINGLDSGYDWDGSGIFNNGVIVNITNNTGATISGDVSAINNSGSISVITNNGTLSSNFYTIENIGLDLTHLATIGVLNNNGVISSSSVLLTIAIDNNYGTIGTINNNTGATISTITTNNINTLAIYNYAAGIISTLNNLGIISASGTGSGGFSAGVFNDTGDGTGAAGIIQTINNTATGSIVATGNSATPSYGIYNNTGAIINTINNAGSISGSASGGTAWGIYNVSNIGTITNTGTITGTTYGIYNTGTITTLNNGQGGTATHTSNGNALTYYGASPQNYNIIITSASHYGQLINYSSSGSMAFGISALSTKGSGVLGNYSTVLNGITSANLGYGSATTSGTQTSNGYTYTLNETASGSNIWDLSLLSAPPLPVTGPSTADTQQSLVNTASVLQNTFTLQNSVLANSFSYDCNVFGANDVCVSAGGRNTAVSAANGLNNTSALLIAAYRVMPTVRVGAYADQNLSVNNAGSTVNLGNNTPLIGLFGAWNERLDGTGTEVKVSAAYGQKNTTVTRQVVGTSEAGSGSSQLNSQGAQVAAKYGFGVTPDVIVSPYVGIRYTQNNMNGYTEAASSTVTAPLTYSALNTNATTALAGVGAQYKFIPQATAFASVGVETDTNTNNGTYSATGVAGLTPINFNANPVKTRPTATLGAYYDVEKNQRLGITGIYRQEPYQAVQTTTVMATYTVGL